MTNRVHSISEFLSTEAFVAELKRIRDGQASEPMFDYETRKLIYNLAEPKNKRGMVEDNRPLAFNTLTGWIATIEERLVREVTEKLK